MTGQLHTLLLTIHIAAGAIALIAGMIPMLSKKGGRLHRCSGKIYFYCMVAIILTALPMAISGNNLFITAIALFSFYLLSTGLRYTKIKAPTDITFYDKVIFCAGNILSLLLIAYGIYLFFFASDYTPVILTVFGIIFFASAFPDFYFKVYKKPPVNKEGIIVPATPNNSWFYEHFSRMIGSYSATFTAFAIINFRFWPPIVNWLLPTFIGIFVIRKIAAHYRRKKVKQPSIDQV